MAAVPFRVVVRRARSAVLRPRPRSNEGVAVPFQPRRECYHRCPIMILDVSPQPTYLLGAMRSVHSSMVLLAALFSTTPAFADPPTPANGTAPAEVTALPREPSTYTPPIVANLS